MREIGRRLRNAFGVVASLGVFRRIWFGMLAHYERDFPDFPIVPLATCGDVNDPAVLEMIGGIGPDLVIVSGTNLLKKPLIEIIHRTGRVMNLHTGISPFVKGSPSCTNWCLYLREFDMIGNSIMWLDVGIDSGNLIKTARTPLTGYEDLLGLHIKVMDHGHRIYADAVGDFVAGRELPNVPQSTIPGHRLFLSKHWGVRQMWRALTNFWLYYRPGSRYFKINDGRELV